MSDQVLGQSSQLSKSLRASRGEHALVNSQNKALENSQLYLERDIVGSTVIDHKSLADQQQKLALSQTIKMRNFCATANELLTQEDGTEQTKQIRQIEQLYITELRKQLDFNRSRNEQLRLKQSIHDASKTKFSYLMSQSQHATDMLSSAVPNRENMLRQMEERQMSLSMKIMSDDDRFFSLKESNRLQQFEIYDKRVKDEELTQQYLENLKIAREKAAYVGNQQLLQKELQQKQRLSQIKHQESANLEQSSAFNTQRLFGGQSLKKSRDLELETYKLERLKLQQQKIDHACRAKSAYYAQLSQQAAASIPDGQAKYQLVQQMKEVERVNTCDRIRNETMRCQQQLVMNHLAESQNIDERAELMNLRQQYAGQVIQNQQVNLQQQYQRQKQARDDQLFRKQLDRERAIQMDRERQLINAAASTFIFHNARTHDFDVSKMGENLRSAIKPGSLLAMSREDAAAKVMQYEEEKHNTYFDASRSEASVFRSAAPTKSPESSQKLSQQLMTSQVTELPAITRSQLSMSSTQPVQKQQIENQQAQEQDQRIKQLRAQHNKTMMELLQLEKQRNLQRAEALRTAPASQRDQLKSVYESEQAAFQQKVKLLDDRLQHQIGQIMNATAQ